MLTLAQVWPTPQESAAVQIRLLTVLLIALHMAGGVFFGTPGAASAAATRASSGVISRSVVFELINGDDDVLACTADGREHQVRGRLVGPRKDVLGRGGVLRINVLVHDLGTGGWFWNLRRHPSVDYATRLAHKGETSLVLDRLGYDRSPLADGDATCLDAQASMLHQAIQHLYSGLYDFAHGDRFTPHASQVIVHGHGVGAAIGQLEASRYDDTAGLVLMSWSGAGQSARAQRQDREQLRRCAGSATYAAYGHSRAGFRKLLFATAAPRVRYAATIRRNRTPCGDVQSLTVVKLDSARTAGAVDVPVLLLRGRRDARVGPQDFRAYASSFDSSSRVTTRVIPRAGSALPLEASAARTRAVVLRWLRGTPTTS